MLGSNLRPAHLGNKDSRAVAHTPRLVCPTNFCLAFSSTVIWIPSMLTSCLKISSIVRRNGSILLIISFKIQPRVKAWYSHLEPSLANRGQLGSIFSIKAPNRFCLMWSVHASLMEGDSEKLASPARCWHTSAMVISSLPFWPNSGQYLVTLSSYSNNPLLWRTANATASRDLPELKIVCQNKIWLAFDLKNH